MNIPSQRIPYPYSQEHKRDGQESGNRSTSPVVTGYYSTTSPPPPSPPSAANLSVPPPNFYNLQMYHDTGLQSQAMSQTYVQHNPYQSVQEVPYHHIPLNRYSNASLPTITQVQGQPQLQPQAQPQAQPQPQAQAQLQHAHVQTHTSPVLQPIYATFGPESIFVTCPYCHHTESTEIEQKVGSEALLWACIIPLFGFLRRSKWETRHRCRNCLNVIGIYYP